MILAEIRMGALFFVATEGGRMKLFLTMLFSIGLISMIWSCLVVASNADDRSEEYWRNKGIEKER